MVGSALGLVVHFAIIAAMVPVNVAAAEGIAALTAQRLLWGTVHFRAARAV